MRRVACTANRTLSVAHSTNNRTTSINSASVIWALLYRRSRYLSTEQTAVCQTDLLTFLYIVGRPNCSFRASSSDPVVTYRNRHFQQFRSVVHNRWYRAVSTIVWRQSAHRYCSASSAFNQRKPKSNQTYVNRKQTEYVELNRIYEWQHVTLRAS